LKTEGTLWLNLGDSYNSTSGFSRANEQWHRDGRDGGANDKKAIKHPVLKEKDQCLIPHRIAMALQEDGWYLRDTIVWHKPNPMPESVSDRCTKAHEYIFLLSKQPRYYYDNEAIKEEANYDGRHDTVHKGSSKYVDNSHLNNQSAQSLSVSPRERWTENDNGVKVRNKRSVWTVPTAPYSEAHFATFPPKLIEPCILAGCPKEVCPKCGKARGRIVEKESHATRPIPKQKRQDALGKVRSDQGRHVTKTKTTGWTDCGCGAGFEPGIVFDPFMGAYTTALVAYQNNRNYTGCELNPEYIKLGEKRLQNERNKFDLFENNSCVNIEPVINLNKTKLSNRRD